MFCSSSHRNKYCPHPACESCVWVLPSPHPHSLTQIVFLPFLEICMISDDFLRISQFPPVVLRTGNNPLSSCCSGSSLCKVASVKLPEPLPWMLPVLNKISLSWNHSCIESAFGSAFVLASLPFDLRVLVIKTFTRGKNHRLKKESFFSSSPTL